MQLYKSWVCWRYEFVKDIKKPTKIPYNPITAQRASVTDPSTWEHFGYCVQAATQTAFYDGIGFVLSEKDPYAIIDLDDPEDNEDILRRHAYLYDHFDSYIERSPSGKGVHIIVKATVADGRRKSKIELYSTERYMTMTGDVLKNMDIANYSQDIGLLWQELGGGFTGDNYRGNAQTLTDEDVLNSCLCATNSAKFVDLWSGKWEGHYDSHSQADLGLINHLTYWSENRGQVARLFLQSGLGQREKANRKNYVEGLIEKAFDRVAPPVDFSTIITSSYELAKNDTAILAAESKEAVLDVVHSSGEFTDLMNDIMHPIPIYNPPGMLGELAMAIYSAAPRPVYDIALVGAIGMMAGITGRTYNISNTGLNQYLLVLAATGMGKDTAVIGIDRLINNLRMRVPSIMGYRRTGNIQSGPALYKMMDEQPCVFSLKGEYGMELRKMSNRDQTAIYSDMKAAFLEMYSKSGKHGILQPLVYSDKAKNTKSIVAPSFTFICESTPETVFENVDESMVSDGLLSRFNIVYYKGKRPCNNKSAPDYTFSEHLLNKVADITAYCNRMMLEDKFIDVSMEPDAEAFLDRVDMVCDTIINDNTSDSNLTALLNRVHLKTMKLAALIAVCDDPYKPKVTLQAALWSYNFVNKCTQDLVLQFQQGLVGKASSEGRQVAIVRDALAGFFDIEGKTLRSYGVTPELQRAGVIPYTYLYRKVSNKRAFTEDRQGTKLALAKIIGVLLETGELTEVPSTQLKTNFNLNGRAFCLNKGLTT